MVPKVPYVFRELISWRACSLTLISRDCLMLRFWKCNGRCGLPIVVTDCLTCWLLLWNVMNVYAISNLRSSFQFISLSRLVWLCAGGLSRCSRRAGFP